MALDEAAARKGVDRRSLYQTASTRCKQARRTCLKWHALNTRDRTERSKTLQANELLANRHTTSQRTWLTIFRSPTAALTHSTPQLDSYISLI